MSIEEVLVLVPSHSIEDFPTDLAEKPALSLLNSFAVAFHPRLLAASGKLPGWRRAEDAPEDCAGRIFFIPLPSDAVVPGGWKDKAREQGATVVSGLEDRAKMTAAAIANLPAVTTAPPNETASGDDGALQPNTEPVELDADLVADFHALGTCWLLLELLTRHMHHFSSYDETFLSKTSVEAAYAAIEGKTDYAKDRLRACFDLMAEARERFYPVDCYLIELCLLTPDQAKESLKDLLRGTLPVNYLLKGEDAEQIVAAQPELQTLLKEAWARGAADIVGGDHREVASPLVPLESTLHDLEKGRETFRRLFDRVPTTWARRRYGLSTLIPQILQKYGYHSGLHVLLDDGIYPDREQSKLRWDGCDSSSVDAYTRIPLAADSATTYLRLPQRMAETMQSDQVAALVLARWPDVKCPLVDDLRRIQKYAPVLGRAVTFDEYFQHSSSTGGWGLDDKNYLAPFLTQAVARREERPLSRYVQHTSNCARYEVAEWQAHVTQALYSRAIDGEAAFQRRDKLEAAGPDTYGIDRTDGATARQAAEEMLAEYQSRASSSVSKLILSGAGTERGFLVTNPLSFPRRVVVELPESGGPPKVDGPVKSVQFDGTRKLVMVDVPPAGFAWFADGQGGATTKPQAGSPLANGLMLQNELFEVQLSDVTGGLQRLKHHGRHPNRLSQQLAFRFPREKVFKRGSGDDAEEIKTWYSEMRYRSSRVTSSGPLLGEIVTAGDIVDPSDGSKLADFEQTFRVWLGRPLLEIEISINPLKMPEGDPWSNYFGSRFAWHDSGAAFSGSLYGVAQPLKMERIESLDFLEIASDAERTTIVPCGLPFHRKTGMRMVDSLLIVDGESERKFRFVIALDQNFAGELTRDVTSPVRAISTTSGPPRSGPTGWFYKIDTRLVQVTKLMPLMVEPVERTSDWEQPEPEVQSLGKGFALRMQETEGRYESVYLELFRRPSSARVRDGRGRTISDLPPSGDGLRIEFSPFAIIDVEVKFD